MEILLQYKTDIAAIILRLVLGILFLAQGYDKLFGLGLKKTEEGMEEALRPTHLPNKFIDIVTVISSIIEFLAAILLIVGFWIYPALALLGMDMIVVVAGMSLRQPLWDMRYVWPRLVLIIILLLFPMEKDRFSLDYFLNTYSQNLLSQ